MSVLPSDIREEDIWKAFREAFPEAFPDLMEITHQGRSSADAWSTYAGFKVGYGAGVKRGLEIALERVLKVAPSILAEIRDFEKKLGESVGAKKG